jgi:hypothetical protein
MSVNLPCAGPLPDDIARDIVRIPCEVLSCLGIAEHDYVRIWGTKDSCIKRAYKLPSESEHIIRVRASTREVIGAKIGDIIRIEPVRAHLHVTVQAHFARQEDVGKGICRLHSKVFSKLEISKGNWVEIFNLDTCGRIFLCADKHDLPYENAILLDKHARKLLAIDEKRMGKHEAPEIGVRKSIFPIRKEGILDHIYKFIVGYKWLSLRVAMGEDVDEGKSIARMRKDNMAIIGVKENDVCDICWENKRVKCRVLQMTDQQNDENHIMTPSERGFLTSLCASERRRLDVDLGDIISIRRSPLFVLKANADRAIITAITALGFYATLLLQLKVDLPLALGSALVVGAMLLWLLFAKVRSEV